MVCLTDVGLVYYSNSSCWQRLYLVIWLLLFQKTWKRRRKVVYELFMSLRKWSAFLAISSFHVCSVYPWTSTPCFFAFCNTSSSVSPYIVCVHTGSPASLQFRLESFWKIVDYRGVKSYCLSVWDLYILRNMTISLYN